MARARALIRAVSAAAIAFGLAALGSSCEAALHAGREDPLCNVTEGTRCPGSDDVCYYNGEPIGHCRACSPKTEVCNGIDDDCDGVADEGFDKDKDGYTSCGGGDHPGVEAKAADCNDDPFTGGAAIHPGAVEICNGIDDNCNSLTDEGTCPGGECWPSKPGCIPGDDCCTVKGDCRVHGCTTLGCNTATGKCDAFDCTAGGCPLTYQCDPLLRACVRKVKLGESCNSVDQCAEGVCVDAKIIGLRGSGKVCALACCMSNDCPTGFICNTASNGATMCVKGGEFGLAPGNGAANSVCGTDSQCRSGRCSHSRCIDSCCGEIACGSGGTCSFASDGRFLCRDPAGPGRPGDACNVAKDCKSGVCLGYGDSAATTCSKRCCTSFDCSPDLHEHCVIQKVSATGYAPVCVQDSAAQGGNKKGGSACFVAGDCRSGVCNDGRCSELCCHNSDCDPATVCKPSPSGPLRCLAK